MVRRVGKPTLYERGCHRPIFPHHWLKQSACGRACWPMPDEENGVFPELPGHKQQEAPLRHQAPRRASVEPSTSAVANEGSSAAAIRRCRSRVAARNRSTPRADRQRQTQPEMLAHGAHQHRADRRAGAEDHAVKRHDPAAHAGSTAAWISVWAPVPVIVIAAPATNTQGRARKKRVGRGEGEDRQRHQQRAAQHDSRQPGDRRAQHHPGGAADRAEPDRRGQHRQALRPAPERPGRRSRETAR